MRQYIVRVTFKNGNYGLFSPKAVSPGEALTKVIRANNIEIEKVKSFYVKVGEKIA